MRLLHILIAALTALTLAAADKPNIIFVMADDLGYGDLGCYGQQRIKTPNLDKMAREGIRFTSAYAGSTVCAPSRSALMTGQHTGHTRIRGNARHPLLPGDVTVAEVLKQAGYKTALIGKWGLGEAGSTGTPNAQGFDYFFGYLNQRHAHNYYPTFLWRNDQKVALPNVVPNEDAEGSGMASEKKVYSHDLIMDEALKWLDENGKAPFFLYLAPTLPHANNEARQLGMEIPSDAPYSGENWPQAQKNHAAMITRLDTDVGNVLAKLKELGVDKNTVVFFMSDNGAHREGGNDPEFNKSSGPLRGIKRAMYEGGIRVPAIVRWPGVVQASQVSDYPWANWDFLPTAADLAGAKPPANIDGISIAPLLRGKRQPSHPPFYWEFHEGGSKQAVRMGNLKAVRNEIGGPIELYDLTADLGESSNIAAQHPETVAAIEAYLKTARTESEHWPLRTAPAPRPANRTAQQ